MRIALLTDGIWPYVIGGMQKHSYFLCKYFAKNGVNVLLIHSAPVITKEIEDLSCFTGEEKQFIISVVIKRPDVVSFPGHYIYQSWLYSRAIYKTLNGFPNVDFIIAKGMTGMFFIHKKSSEITPVSINIHGYEFMQKKSGIKMELEALLLKAPLTWITRNADYVFSYGGRITDFILKLGVSSDKIIEAPSAVEAEWMSGSNRSVNNIRRFVFIGRYERRKGIKELQDVIIKLSRKYQFSFEFIGPVPKEIRLTLPSVKYHGVIMERVQLQDILGSCDILVCPSYAEGMPNVILEGMANGCSVIATDVGAVSQLVNKSTGWLIPPADRYSLEKAMIEVIECNDGDLVQKKINAFQTIEENYQWKDVSKRIIERIIQILNR